MFTLTPHRNFGALAIDRASVTAIAVALYRLDHAGQLPSGLEELRPAYLADLPIDPASGQPFRFKADERSFTIYSVGDDGKDDGGI